MCKGEGVKKKQSEDPNVKIKPIVKRQVPVVSRKGKNNFVSRVPGRLSGGKCAAIQPAGKVLGSSGQ